MSLSKNLLVGYSSGYKSAFSVVETSIRDLGHSTPRFSFLPRHRLSISQPGQLPEIIGNTDKLPYQPYLLQTPVQKSPEFEDILCLAEYVLNQAGPAPHSMFTLLTR